MEFVVMYSIREGVDHSRQDAERFIAEDPFATEGLADPRILEWNAVRFE